MKLRSLFLASLAAMAMVSCSNEDDQIVNNEPVNENALMQFGFSYLESSATRAEPSLEPEAGLDTEQKFADVVLVLAYDNTAKTVKIPRANFTPVTTTANPATDGKYYQSAPITVPEGDVDVYAVLNAGENETALMGLNGNTSGKAAIKSAIEALKSSEIAKASIANEFVMYGASTANLVKNQTTPVSVQVSRIVAKLKECSGTLSFDVEKTATGGSLNKKITVTLNGYAFTNLTDKSNLVPGLANIDTYLTATVYPNTLVNYGNYAYNAMTAAVADANRITYCFENKNAETTADLGDKITSVVYKAKMTVDGIDADKNIYIYNNTVYQYSDLNATVVPGWDNLKLTETSSIADYEAQAIRKYEAGVCYYRQVIRTGNTLNTNGVAEIRRNNVYKLKVATVAKIGFPTPEHKEDLTMMRLNLEVMPWIVNNNDFNL